MISIGIEKVNIDVNLIPMVPLGTLCRAIVAGAEKFFQNPENEEDFQKWLLEYKKQKNSELGEKK